MFFMPLCRIRDLETDENIHEPATAVNFMTLFPQKRLLVGRRVQRFVHTYRGRRTDGKEPGTPNVTYLRPFAQNRPLITTHDPNELNVAKILSLRGSVATVAISSTSDSDPASNHHFEDSPGGATDNSPGRKPWVKDGPTMHSPGGAKEPFDYNAIAEVYDAHRRGRGPFLPALVRLAGESKATRVLDLGCGTGNSAGAFLDAYPCALTGVDRAPRMLARARAKDVASAHWVNADATGLPFADGSFDFAFGVLMLHLNLDIAPVLTECYRVLRGGRVAFVTAPQEFIRNHVLNCYFPSFAKIDLERFQSEEAVSEALRHAGFSEIQSELTKRDPEPVDAAYVDKVANHFITTLRLIPEDEFAAGLEALRADVARNGRLDEPMVWEAVVISGRKSPP